MYWKTLYLTDVIRDNIPNTRGFISLRALRLFEQGEKTEAKAYKLKEKTKKDYGKI